MNGSCGCRMAGPSLTRRCGIVIMNGGGYQRLS